MKEIEKMKTPYDWCVEVNIRVLDINEWPDVFHGSAEKCYHETKYNKEDFMAALAKCKVKPNSTPRKTEPYLEYRMYGLVPYNISGIQAGIQYGHAIQEYNNIFLDGKLTTDLELIAFNKWRKEDKTFIICNGGTTNEDFNGQWYGNMQQQRDRLGETGILFSEFHEPDLNNALSGFVFLVDERVFDRETYPDYVNTPTPWSHADRFKVTDSQKRGWETMNEKNREKWVEKIGGPNNDFLRQYVDKRVMRLANN